MAVYTTLSDDDIAGILQSYALGTLQSATGISDGVQNSNYIVTTDQRRALLTIFEDTAIYDDIPLFFEWMEHLSSRGIPCAAPLHDKADATIQDFNGKPASLVSFIEGKWPKTIRADHCQEIGHYSAHMHLLADDFKPRRDDPASLDLTLWYRRSKEQGFPINDLKAGLSEEIEASAERIMDAMPEEGSLPTGMVHGDLFPDNVLFLDKKVSGIIDFYMSRYDFYASDLANTMNAWCFEHGTAFNITKAKALLRAYQAERTLSKEELNALPILCAAWSLRLMLTRLYAWFSNQDVGSSLIKNKDPLEQLERLRFHLQVRSVREYGIDD